MQTALVGFVGALIGIIVGQFLSAYQGHATWVKDNERAEYRELWDLLYQTVRVVHDNRPNLSSFNVPPVNVAVAQLSRAFADRIFIADALAEVGAVEDWYYLKQVIYYEPTLQAETPTELRYSLTNLHDREDKLRNKILEQAKKNVVKFKFSSARTAKRVLSKVFQSRNSVHVFADLYREPLF